MISIQSRNPARLHVDHLRSTSVGFERDRVRVKDPENWILGRYEFYIMAS